MVTDDGGGDGGGNDGGGGDGNDDDDDDDVTESTRQHGSAGSNCDCAAVVAQTVLHSPSVDVAQVRQPSSTADQHSL